MQKLILSYANGKTEQITVPDLKSFRRSKKGKNKDLLSITVLLGEIALYIIKIIKESKK